MRWLCVVCCLLGLAVSDGVRSCQAQAQDEQQSETLRQELAASRRVGYLRREDSRGYFLQDNWDKQTYRVEALEGLDLEPFVDRYITLRGETLTALESGSRTFVAKRVTALDGQQPASGRGADVRRASVDVQVPESLDRLQGERPSRPGRLAALADGLPRPSEVLEEIQPPTASRAAPSTPSLNLGPPPDTNWLDLDMGMVVPEDRWWARGEYLYWIFDGMQTPPLVTTSPPGTPRADAGVLGEPGTTVLFGGNLNNEGQSGVRAQLGYWLNSQRTFGVDADAAWFYEQDASFSAASLGSPILARPFFDALNGEQTAELVAFPGVLRGRVTANANTEFWYGGLRARLNACGAQPCSCSLRARRVDCLVGYRTMRLADSLSVQENLVSLDPLNQGLFEITDSFESENQFHGIDVGFVEQFTRGAFSFEWVTKVAVGINQQTVTINGGSLIDEAGLLEPFVGGLLAQRTNIGQYSRDEFAVVPELSATIGWHVNSQLTFTLGYTLIYFANVVRAGDQIDLAINSNLLPPEADPFSGPLLPAFAFQDTNFWVHGASVGADFRW